MPSVSFKVQTKSLPQPELFLALIGATGTDLNLVRLVLSEELSRVSYDSKEIRLSDELKRLAKGQSTSASQPPEDERINAAMNLGNEFRRKLKDGAAVAYLGIRRIRELRAAKSGGEGSPVERYAYLISSLKHPTEVTALRAIYGPLLFVISVFSPRHERMMYLTERIAKSRRVSDKNQYRAHAEKLIERDASEKTDDKLGQDVRETFPLADVFLRMGDKESLRAQVRRFIELIFGHPFRTPTKDEQGMYLAKAASLRSADLSRQIGAVISTSEGSVISIGCNEVPISGGGSFWEDDRGKIDNRDFRLGQDKNTKLKEEMLAEVFKSLSENGWIVEHLGKIPIEDFIQKALRDPDAPLKEARIATIIEYGRIVHAEMNALMDATRRGVSVKGCTLYSTTFPCHICTRHIMSAGITRVVYIEPYPKSMAVDLYGRSLQVEDEPADKDAIGFEPFVGIAPARYSEMFEMISRKSPNGDAINWDPQSSRPRFLQYQIEGFTYIPSYLANYFDGEAAALKLWEKPVQEELLSQEAEIVPGSS